MGNRWSSTESTFCVQLFSIPQNGGAFFLVPEDAFGLYDRYLSAMMNNKVRKDMISDLSWEIKVGEWSIWGL